ncbi:MAG: transcriptional repressor [Thermodesulfobacteriota bacterium]
MKHLHSREKTELKKILSQNGFAGGPDLLDVLDTFLAQEEHQKAADLHRRLKARGIQCDLGFVEEALELFCRYGFAQAKEFKGQDTLYEHRHLGQHHDHLVCIRCGKVEEFVNPLIEDLQVGAAKDKGFVPLDHRLEVYGLCEDCARRPGEELRLCDAEEGERLLVCGHRGGGELDRRLHDMGLTDGAELEVISAAGGPVVVACRGSRLALGQGMSEKILVVPKHGDEDRSQPRKPRARRRRRRLLGS